MRTAVIVSATVHLGLVASLLIVRSSATVIVPGPDVVQVALIGQPEPEVAPAPTPPAPEPVAPTETQGVRIEKPRPQAKPEEPKPQAKPAAPRPTPPTATPARTTLADAPMGEGMSGTLAVEGDFEFAYYLAAVRNQIARNWSPPAGSGGGTHAVIVFRIARDGSLSGAAVEQGSGSEFFDQSALRAVIVTGKLPPLPLGYSGADLGVHFGFEYTGP